MYSLKDALTVKEDWGHSSGMVGIEICHRAGVKHLCLFHHDPAHDDETLSRMLARMVRYEKLHGRAAHHGRDQEMTVSCAYDGMEIEI